MRRLWESRFVRGLVLIAIVIAVNALAWSVRRAGERLAG